MHNMGAFHSSTDISELQDNAKNYNFYISLVVDFKEKYDCKIVFPCKPQNLVIKDENGNDIIIPYGTNGDVLIESDLDIVMPEEGQIDPWVKSRVEELQKIKTSSVGKGFNNTYFPRTFVDTYDDGPNNFNKYLSTPATTTKPFISKVEKFAVALLNADDTIDTTLKESIKGFNTVSPEEFEFYLELLDSNIEIIHYNIYNSNYNIDKHIEEVITLLEKEPNNYKLNKVINLLKDSVTV